MSLWIKNWGKQVSKVKDISEGNIRNGKSLLLWKHTTFKRIVKNLKTQRSEIYQN